MQGLLDGSLIDHFFGLERRSRQLRRHCYVVRKFRRSIRGAADETHRGVERHSSANRGCIRLISAAADIFRAGHHFLRRCRVLVMRLVLRDVDLLVCFLVHFLLLLHGIAYDLIVEVSIHGTLLLSLRCLRCVWALA